MVCKNKVNAQKRFQTFSVLVCQCLLWYASVKIKGLELPQKGSYCWKRVGFQRVSILWSLISKLGCRLSTEIQTDTYWFWDWTFLAPYNSAPFIMDQRWPWGIWKENISHRNFLFFIFEFLCDTKSKAHMIWVYKLGMDKKLNVFCSVFLSHEIFPQYINH